MSNEQTLRAALEEIADFRWPDSVDATHMRETARAALAAPSAEQSKPVAWMTKSGRSFISAEHKANFPYYGNQNSEFEIAARAAHNHDVPLYAAPHSQPAIPAAPEQPLGPLTAIEEIELLAQYFDRLCEISGTNAALLLRKLKSTESIAQQAAPERSQPTELEMHRADYDAIRAAGWECPGELLADYETLQAKLAQQAAPERATVFPERDKSKSAEQQGLFQKFIVTRTDGSSAPGGKHAGCRYFVLDMDHDAFAAAALISYTNACATTHPQLASDLRRQFSVPSPQQAAIPGYVLVPVEPTLEMIAAFQEARSSVLQAYVGAKEKANRRFTKNYRRMLAAAPSPQQRDESKETK